VVVEQLPPREEPQEGRVPLEEGTILRQVLWG
jgi:hypothetical protein